MLTTDQIRELRKFKSSDTFKILKKLLAGWMEEKKDEIISTDWGVQLEVTKESIILSKISFMQGTLNAWEEVIHYIEEL